MATVEIEISTHIPEKKTGRFFWKKTVPATTSVENQTKRVDGGPVSGVFKNLGPITFMPKDGKILAQFYYWGNLVEREGQIIFEPNTNPVDRDRDLKVLELQSSGETATIVNEIARTQLTMCLLQPQENTTVTFLSNPEPVGLTAKTT